MAFVATELHRGVGALFAPGLSPEAKEAGKITAGKKIDQLVQFLDGGKKRYLNGTSLSAADIYAYIVLGWTAFLGITLSAPAQAYFDGLKADERLAKAHSALSAAN